MPPSSKTETPGWPGASATPGFGSPGPNEGDARPRRVRDGLGIASGLDARLVERLEPALHLAGDQMVVGVVHIGVAGGEREHARTLGADEDRRASGPGAARGEDAVLRLVVLPLEIDAPLAEERHDDRERLLEAPDPVVLGDAEGVVFRLVPAGAEPEDDAPVRHLVERVRHLGRIAGFRNSVQATSGPGECGSWPRRGRRGWSTTPGSRGPFPRAC